ncbi:hypothetical protein ASE00_00470 [Sphingomonas sp. Root710]|nr:hypothetical protein ASE00_00470 [Sphingomonas sp. Root710]
MVTALAHAIAPGCAIESNELAQRHQGLVRDERLLGMALEGSGLNATTRLWVNHPCLVVPSGWARKTGFERAAAKFAAKGWPVYLRASGGSAVVHRPGILNVSRIEPASPNGFTIDTAYGALVEQLLVALASLGIVADAGPVPGSYCDGRFNIRATDRKLAGTACLVRRTTSRAAILTHAAVSIEGDVARDVAIVSAFEAALGIRAIYRADRHCTVQQLADAAGSRIGG